MGEAGKGQKSRYLFQVSKHWSIWDSRWLARAVQETQALGGSTVWEKALLALLYLTSAVSFLAPAYSMHWKHIWQIHEVGAFDVHFLFPVLGYQLISISVRLWMSGNGSSFPPHTRTLPSSVVQNQKAFIKLVTISPFNNRRTIEDLQQQKSYFLLLPSKMKCLEHPSLCYYNPSYKPLKVIEVSTYFVLLLSSFKKYICWYFSVVVLTY